MLDNMERGENEKRQLTGPEPATSRSITDPLAAESWPPSASINPLLPKYQVLKRRNLLTPCPVYLHVLDVYPMGVYVHLCTYIVRMWTSLHFTSKGSLPREPCGNEEEATDDVIMASPTLLL